MQLIGKPALLCLLGIIRKGLHKPAAAAVQSAGGLDGPRLACSASSMPRDLESPNRRKALLIQFHVRMRVLDVHMKQWQKSSAPASSIARFWR
ncbi:hypothetical protein COEREDRAFT_81611 [Coemansia reversa NRRL 1564]|uniref:Uncharacterized protein n=1 Tax=Coemansia reversa (strain ATCC 12441 / NRRL 1564) TaxID=763665 RepID=A0A2G5BA36_COERN|nr:hypothetical protein COEREDRAFT_81611 [Coemansia reversa NRRL 1564]|eukprot:PIA15879.1 hypothetical protein COEREDRAFT_81611 [Coemansia reversa NRRL 1564]